MFVIYCLIPVKIYILNAALLYSQTDKRDASFKTCPLNKINQEAGRVSYNNSFTALNFQKMQSQNEPVTSYTDPWKSESLNLLSPFQVFAEILCCSSAWSHSQISICQALSFNFFTTVAHVYLPHPSAITSSSHLPRIFLAFSHPLSLLLLSFPPSRCLGVRDTGLLMGSSARTCSARTSQVLLNLSCSPSLNEKRPPGWGRRKTEPWIRHESTKNVISDIPNTPYEGALVKLPSMECWLCSVTFWVRDILQLKLLSLLG